MIRTEHTQLTDKGALVATSMGVGYCAHKLYRWWNPPTRLSSPLVNILHREMESVAPFTWLSTGSTLINLADYIIDAMPIRNTTIDKIRTVQRNFSAVLLPLQISVGFIALAGGFIADNPHFIINGGLLIVEGVVCLGTRAAIDY